MIKRLLEKLLGYRWSIYICKNDKEMLMAIHSDSAYYLLGYIQNYFLEFGNPKSPFSIWLNFNLNHRSIQLDESQFIEEFPYIHLELRNNLIEMDPRYRGAWKKAQ